MLGRDAKALLFIMQAFFDFLTHTAMPEHRLMKEIAN
jgi:hypothetical protein